MMLFNSLDTTGTSTIFGDRVLHLEDIRDLNIRLINSAKQTMDELLFNCDMFTIPDDEFIHDEPRNREPGWGFVDD
jgi:hypothetical protein